MASTNVEKQVKVLITGFGPFLDIKTNPSSTIASALPSLVDLPDVQIVAHPTIEVSYQAIYAAVPKLLDQHQPDIVVLMGVDADRDYFAVEKGANKEGYHDVPDVKRKVFTRAENKKAWGKGPGTLQSSLNLEGVVERWKEGVQGLDTGSKSKSKDKGKGKTKGQSAIDVRLSDDVGNFVCGFIYYASLLERGNRGQGKEVVFYHVPRLETEEEVNTGTKVSAKLVEALVEVWREDRQ